MNRKKHWLSYPWTYIGAGALMGLMSGTFFVLSAIAEFHNEHRSVAIGYLVLATAFPIGTTLTGWLMGKDVTRKSASIKTKKRGRWHARLRPLVDCGDLTPLVLVIAGTSMGVGTMIFIEGEKVLGAMFLISSIAIPPLASIPERWTK